MANMADRMYDFLQSDSDSSEFEGFNESDIGSDIDLDIDFPSDDSSSDDSLSDAEEINEEWTRNFSDIRIDDFAQDWGPNLPADFDVSTASALDYFWLMILPTTLAEIARHTNSFARWVMETTGSNDPRWSDTNTAEIRAFIGMNILMGVNSLPEVDMYWSTYKYLGNDGLKEIMTCNRYQKLTQYFHVSDRSQEPARNQPGYDRLCKVRPIVDHVSQNFLQRYTLSRDVAVDEAMVRYTGKLSFKQYMPAKPIKRGVKIWMACDANTAYLSRFDIYLGRNNNQTEHGLGYNVVRKLTDNLHGSNRHVYFDNFFTSIPLMTDLLKDGLYSCGTVRTNRKGFPAQMKKPTNVKERGQYVAMQKGRTNLTATCWKDNRLVHHLATNSDPTDTSITTRRSGPNILNVNQPATVNKYNMYMGGVDQHDQYRMKYDVGRNSKKWWKYIFWFLINCSIVNAYIIYKKVSTRVTKKKRFRHLDFRCELARDLIAGYCSRKRKRSECSYVGLVDAENIGGHISCRLPGKKGRCRYHLRVHKVRKETVYGCSVCQVHLCKDGCHSHFHNQ